MSQPFKDPPSLHPSQDIRELQQMTRDALVDIARNGGIPSNGINGNLPKSVLEERISKAQTFAASLPAKYPSSFESGASARGDWWGFPGDYEVLDSGDLVTAATFGGVKTMHHCQYAPIPLMRWVPAFPEPGTFCLDVEVHRRFEACHGWNRILLEIEIVESLR